MSTNLENYSKSSFERETNDVACSCLVDEYPGEEREVLYGAPLVPSPYNGEPLLHGSVADSLG